MNKCEMPWGCYMPFDQCCGKPKIRWEYNPHSGAFEEIKMCIQEKDKEWFQKMNKLTSTAA